MNCDDLSHCWKFKSFFDCLSHDDFSQFSHPQLGSSSNFDLNSIEKKKVVWRLFDLSFECAQESCRIFPQYTTMTWELSFLRFEFSIFNFPTVVETTKAESQIIHPQKPPSRCFVNPTTCSVPRPINNVLGSDATYPQTLPLSRHRHESQHWRNWFSCFDYTTNTGNVLNIVDYMWCRQKEEGEKMSTANEDRRQRKKARISDGNRLTAIK